MIDVSDFLKGSLALAVALSWNTAVRSMIEYSYPSNSKEALISQFAYSVVIAIFAIIFIVIYNIFYDCCYGPKPSGRTAAFVSKDGHFYHPL